MRRSEVILLGFSLASALFVVLAKLGLWSVAGSIRIGLYPLYSVAAIGGWLSGNLYVWRIRQPARPSGALLLTVYLVAPAGLLAMLRAMAPLGEQATAPLVPLFSWGIFLVFFLVPVSLASTRKPLRRLRISKPEEASNKPLERPR